MDYERKYKELVDNFKSVLNLRAVKENGTIPTEDVRKLIPELQTPNDGEIIKELIDYLDVQDAIAKGKDSDFKNWIAWLKKQKEKELDTRSNYLEELIAADDIYQMAMNDAMIEEAKTKAMHALSKLEISKLLFQEDQNKKIFAVTNDPKFKTGDWITNGYCIIKITSVDDRYYWHDNGCVGGDIESIDREYHLWTIQDAKDGDVLSDKNPFIFRGFGDKRHPNSPTAYCGMNLSGTFILSTENEWWTEYDVYPATKEQRDLLFQKMKEEGYEWNADNKELRKIEQIEQNPTWGEEDEKTRKAILELVKQSSHILNPMNQKSMISWLEKQGDKVDVLDDFPTEFERQISHLIASSINKEWEYKKDFVKHTANALLQYAKNEFEKQGEQKPADKVEPKFKPGDNIIEKDLNECGSGTIKEIKNNKYYFTSGTCIDIQEQDLWQLVKEHVEPKFKVGDWVVDKLGHVWHINSFDKKNYNVSNGDKYNYFPISKQNEMRFWTIQDAEDGDVLANKDGAIFINACSNGGGTLDCHCYISVQGEFCLEEHKTGSWLYKTEIHPATKEQRDILFSKMKEEGYEWNDRKKELKKLNT